MTVWDGIADLVVGVVVVAIVILLILMVFHLA